MRLRNKMAGTTLVAELDISRMADQHSRYVLVLHDDINGAAALGPLTASLGYEIVESTPEEWAALMLAGFQLPHERFKRSHLQQLTCLMRAMKPKGSKRKRMDQTESNRSAVELKQSEDSHRRLRQSLASRIAARKHGIPATGGRPHAESSVMLAGHLSEKRTQCSSNPEY